MKESEQKKKKQDGEREREWGENPVLSRGVGETAIEKLLNLHLAGLIGNEEAY